MTVQVGDELERKMKEITDVNWSDVVRECLERYCSTRQSLTVGALAQKMKDQKGEAYSEGYKAALEWFKQKEITYEDVNAISQTLDDFNSEWDRKVEEKYGSWEEAQDVEPLIGERYETEERLFWWQKVEEIVKDLPASYKLTDAFVEGFKDAIQKLLKVQ